MSCKESDLQSKGPILGRRGSPPRRVRTSDRTRVHALQWVQPSAAGAIMWFSSSRCNLLCLHSIEGRQISEAAATSADGSKRVTFCPLWDARIFQRCLSRFYLRGTVRPGSAELDSSWTGAPVNWVSVTLGERSRLSIEPTVRGRCVLMGPERPASALKANGH